MKRPRVPLTLVWLALSFGCWVGAGTLQGRIQMARQDLQLTVDPSVIENLPPSIALSQVASGSFRGLLLDLLWTRAENLRQSGRTHEAAQLAAWITELQPRYIAVWTYQAHHLAYNLAVAAAHPVDRWGWVQAGIALLRDRAIPLNPTSRRLHERLGAILNHKIGGDADQSHAYYAHQFARQWEELLGVPPARTGEFADWFAPVAAAPLEVTELALRSREAARLLDELVDRTDLRTSVALLEALGGRGPHADTAATLVASNASPDATQHARAYLRARVLRDVYQMDPALMGDVMRACGPLDWRHPTAHGVYWVVQGVLREAARARAVRWPGAGDLAPQGHRDGSHRSAAMPWTEPGVDDAEVLRRLYQSSLLSVFSQELVRNGRIERSADGLLRVVPEPAFLPFFEICLRGRSPAGRGAQENPEEEDAPERLEQVLQHCLERAALEGDLERTAAFLDRLRARFRRGPERQRLYDLELPDLLAAIRLQGVTTAGTLQETLGDLFLIWLNDGLGTLRPEVAHRCLAHARSVHEQGRAGLAPGEAAGVPDFDSLHGEALAGYFTAPTRVAPLERKIRVWHLLPQPARELLYPVVHETVHHQLSRAGYDPQAAFPAP